MKRKHLIALLLITCVLLGVMFTACDNTPQEPTKLSAPVLTANGNTVSWAAVENAAEYEVFVNDVSIGKQTTLNVTLTKVGNNEVSVKALSNNKDHLDSDKSQSVMVVVPASKLATPILVLQVNVVSWDVVENASQYEVFVNGQSVGKQEGLSYTLTATNVGSYEITVKAIAQDADHLDSDLSEKQTIVIEPTKLATPFVKADGCEFSWQAVANAAKYEVYLDGEKIGEQTETSYTLQPAEYKTYSVTIKAIAVSNDYIDSDLSQAATYTHLQPKLITPLISVYDLSAQWTIIAHATSYEVFIDGESVGEQAEVTYVLPTNAEVGVHTIQVLAKDSTGEYLNSDKSLSVNIIKENAIDFSQPIYVYSLSLESRLERYLLGIADQSNYASLSEPYKATLDNYVDNYLCNIKAPSNSADYAAFAWQLEEVEYDDSLSWVHSGVKVFRIRLQSGMYLTVTKNNYIGTGGDYISESEYVENDIWQYWQFVAISDGVQNSYYIYNVGHGYDWGRTNDYLTDTSRPDGGAELYPMGDDNQVYFPYKVVNINTTVAERSFNDHSGSVTLKNVWNNKIYSTTDNWLAAKDLFANTEISAQYVWTLEKTEYRSLGNAYRIKCDNGKYLHMGDGYMLDLVDYNVDDGAQIFILQEVSGVKNAFKICGALDSDYCIFRDGNDGQNRVYCYSEQDHNNGYPSRWWNSIDHRNDTGSLWIIAPVSDDIKLDAPVLSIDNLNISWQAVNHATAYEVYVDEELANTVTANSFTLVATELKEYKVKVKAITTEENFVSSAFSNEVSYLNSQLEKLPTPAISVEGNVVSWASVGANVTYNVYVNDVLADNVSDCTYTVTAEGKCAVYIVAIAAQNSGYVDSLESNTVIVGGLDLDAPVVVYNLHLEQRFARYLYGIADQSNASTLKAEYQATLEKMDNYLCNMLAPQDASDYASYAWKLEKVSYPVKDWVYGDYDVYRIRLVNGKYLTVAKNNLIGMGGDYVSAAEYKENDIWQYWQFIPVEGSDDEFYIYSLGHGYDWNRKGDFLVDSNRSDGGAEFYGKDNSNAEWFVFKMVNCFGATFAEVAYDDLSGTYALTNLGTGKTYSFNGDGWLTSTGTDFDANNIDQTLSITLEKVAGTTNAYLIKFANGKYLCMQGYRLSFTDIAGAQPFYIQKVAGVKGGFQLSGAIDNIDFCSFDDGNDGCRRMFVYSDTPADDNGFVSRWWGSIDHRNDLESYWILIPQ